MPGMKQKQFIAGMKRERERLAMELQDQDSLKNWRNKLPTLDPNWPANIQDKWFNLFERLNDKCPADLSVSFRLGTQTIKAAVRSAGDSTVNNIMLREAGA